MDWSLMGAAGLLGVGVLIGIAATMAVGMLLGAVRWLQGNR